MDKLLNFSLLNLPKFSVLCLLVGQASLSTNKRYFKVCTDSAAVTDTLALPRGATSLVILTQLERHSLMHTHTLTHSLSL